MALRSPVCPSYKSFWMEPNWSRCHRMYLRQAITGTLSQQLKNYPSLSPRIRGTGSLKFPANDETGPAIWCPQNVRRMRGTFGLKWADLASFGRFRSIFFNDLGVKHLAPKADVTCSNPVGCANDFNWLRDWFEGSGLGCFRIILVVVVPSVSVPKLALLAKLGNWNTKVFAGKPRLPIEQCCHIATNTRVARQAVRTTNHF
jgi:hypothetical protein